MTFAMFPILLVSVIGALESAPTQTTTITKTRTTTRTRNYSSSATRKRRPNFVQLPPLISEVPDLYQSERGHRYSHSHHNNRVVHVERRRSLQSVDIFVTSETGSSGGSASGSTKQNTSFSTKTPSRATKIASKASKSAKSAKASKADPPSKGGGGGIPSVAPTSPPVLTGKSFRDEQVDQFYENYYRSWAPTFAPTHSIMPSTSVDTVDNADNQTLAFSLESSMATNRTNDVTHVMTVVAIGNTSDSADEQADGSRQGNTTDSDDNNDDNNDGGGGGGSLLQSAENMSTTVSIASMCMFSVVATIVWLL